MPIPIIVWGLAAAGGAAMAYMNRNKIKDFVESDAGKGLVDLLVNFTEANNDPQIRARMKEHMDHLVSMPLATRLLLAPKYLSELADDERNYLRSYGHLHCVELENAGRSDEAAAVRGIVHTLEGMCR